MRWLIVEDALRDRKGHWLEWVATFYHGFRQLGDEIVVVADAEVQTDIRDSLAAVPILPPSIWHRMGDGAGRATRHARVLTHAWQTWRIMRRYLAANPASDAIFVPTVSVHHLLAWAWLIKGRLRNQPARVLLFFLTLPVRFDESSDRPVPDGSPTARLFFRLLRWIEPEVRSGKVVLGVETEAARMALGTLSGLPTHLFPQPVIPQPGLQPAAAGPTAVIKMACYGAARSEKGSDVLQDAITIHRRRFPGSRARFTIQWIDDFISDAGTQVVKSSELLRDGKVEYLTRYFIDGEYAGQLAGTQVMLLPYRLASYRLRGSRVVIEAVVNGIPVIATRGSTLAGVVERAGAGAFCEDGDPESLALAIQDVEASYDELRRRAEERKPAAAREFSVGSFRRIFLQSAAGSGAIEPGPPEFSN